MGDSLIFINHLRPIPLFIALIVCDLVLEFNATAVNLVESK